jgi:hypothetical protein
MGNWNKSEKGWSDQQVSEDGDDAEEDEQQEEERVLELGRRVFRGRRRVTGVDSMKQFRPKFTGKT